MTWRPLSLSLATLSTLATFLATFSVPPAVGQVLPSRVVASTGQPAPGSSTVFDRLTPATLSADGLIMFQGRLDRLGPDQQSRTGLWIDIQGTLLPGFLGGDRAESGEIFRDSIQEPVFSPNNNLAFGAHFGEHPRRAGIFLVRPDEAAAAAALKEGDPAPGLPGLQIAELMDQGVYQQLRISDDGFALITAELEDSQGTAAGLGMFLSNGRETLLVAAEGVPVPGLAGATFAGGHGQALLSPRGVAAVHLAIHAPNPDLHSALVRTRLAGSGLVSDTVAVVGGSLPGLAADEVLGTMGLVRTNRAGQIAFTASIESMFGSLRGAGIWTTSSLSGGPTLRYRSDPLSSQQVSWSSQSFALLDDGRIAFVGHQPVGPNQLRSGLFVLGDTPVPRVLEGQPAPGIIGASYGPILRLTANEDGRLAFEAQVAGPGIAVNSRALFVEDEGGQFQRVALVGDLIEVAPGDERTVSAVGFTSSFGTGGSDGLARPFSRRGEFLWYANFIDAGLAILVTDVARDEPPRLVGLEAVQTIQNWRQEIPLIQHKPTLVRAHLQSEVPTSVELVLRGYRDGAELPGSPLRPDGAPARVGTGLSRHSLDGSFNWHLPPSWIDAEGTLRLEVERTDGRLTCEEPDASSDDCSIAPLIEASPEVELRLVAVTYVHRGELFRVDPAQIMALASWIESILPAAQISWSHVEVPWIQPDPPTLVEMFRLAAEIRYSDNCFVFNGCRRLYYAVAHDESHGWETDLLGLAGPTTASGWYPGSPTDLGRHTASHELGHLLGLSHAVHSVFGPTANGGKQGACGSKARADVPDFPHYEEVPSRSGGVTLRPTLGPLTRGEDDKIYGYDSQLGKVVAPSLWFELMSYCQRPPLDHWISRPTHEAILEELRVQSARTAHFTAPTDTLLIHGSIDPLTGAVDLRPVLGATGGALPPPPLAGDYTLHLHRADGTVDSVPFEAQVGEDASEDEPQAFNVVVEATPRLMRLEIAHQGVVLASRAATAPPSVEVLSPNGGEVLTGSEVTIRWSSSDPEGAALTHTVQYSADAGQTWRTLATGLSGGDLVVPRNQLPGSEMGVVRVAAHDGLATAEDVSDATFRLTNHAPFVSLSHLGASPFLEGDRTLVMEASAFDPEDGVLGGSALLWHSDLDGPLGSGERLVLPVESLTAGRHVITVMATDSDGAAANAAKALELGVTFLFENGFEEGDASGWSVAVGMEG